MTAIDNFKKWLTTSGVYERTELATADLQPCAISISSGIKLDFYCPGCKDNSTFSFYNPQRYEPKIFPLRPGKHEPDEPLDVQAGKYIASVIGNLGFSCAREAHHVFRVWLTSATTPTGLSVRKIGQMPSPHDLVGGNLRKYAKIVSDLDLRELQSASICHASGYHVAAFVYLRRVFERRLDEAHALAVKDPGWNEAAYTAQYFTDTRIEMLRDHLPKFLLESAHLYRILSTGIHQLSEQECADAYEACRMATQVILDEEIEKRERTALMQRAAKSLASLRSRMGTSSADDAGEVK